MVRLAKRKVAAPTPTQIAFNQLSLSVCGIFAKYNGKLGARRVADKLLKTTGIEVGRRRLMTVMKNNGLFCRIRRKYKRMSSASANARVLSNCLAGNFKSQKPNQAWRTDTTHIKTTQGIGYLAAVMDDYTRKIIGWT